MRNFKHGLVAIAVFITYFILPQMGEEAVGTCLTPDWRVIQVCGYMAIVYTDYPTNLKSISEFRVNLIGPETVVWFQSSSTYWCKITQVVTVYRNSSFGASLEFHRDPEGKSGDPEFPHVRLKNPCEF